MLLRCHYICHILHFLCYQDQSESGSLTETTNVSLGDNESEEDMAVDEVNKDKISVDDSDLAESGKKNPLVRRQELLIKSGLADVG